MSALTMRMPPELERTATLATNAVDADAPLWAISHDVVNPHHRGHFELKGRRSPRDIFRLPDSGGVIRDWLYTRPKMEAIAEEAFDNSATESTTIFRMESIDKTLGSIVITPTVSNHWLLIPCQTINGFTIGIAYLDVLYERVDHDNRVPPLKVGRFVIEDSTGEVFMTGWAGNIMIVAWIQSIIKCERVRELLLFEAPPTDGMKPRNLILRNSFYERRDCHICGDGRTVHMLKDPCSGIRTNLANDPTQPPPLTNVSTLYRRFRGAYFGVCLKTKYEDNKVLLQQLVPVFTDLRHSLNTVKRRFKSNLLKNTTVLGTECYFGVNPRSASRLYLLRTVPVDTGYPLISLPSDDDDERRPEDMGSMTKLMGFPTSPNSVQQDAEGVSRPESPSETGRRRRLRVEDDLVRNSVEHMRKVRNRESAARSNRIRKQRLEQNKTELEKLKKVVLPELRSKFEAVEEENRALRIRVYGMEI